jgi:hypothetical protein
MAEARGQKPDEVAGGEKPKCGLSKTFTTGEGLAQDVRFWMQ